MRVRGGGRSILCAVAVLASLALAAPAGAATVVNGDFESGNLNGWSVHRLLEVGNWFAYEGTVEPIKREEGTVFAVQAPPQGRFAAISDQLNPDTVILSQDVALEAGRDHRLNLLAYYTSYKAIAVPAPDTLSADGEVLGAERNQQFRIDVMKPGAPIESIDPADILLTVFRTQRGDPKEMPPTRLLANLSPFAGQTVRLRFAVAAHEEVLAAGVDAVAIESAAPGQLPPPKLTPIRIGKVKLNKRNGSATLPVTVPAAGQLSAKGQPPGPKATASKAKKKKKASQLIKPASARAAKAGTVTLRLKPTPAALATLRQKHKLRVKVAVTYRPTGAATETAIVPVVLKLAPPRHRP